MTWDLRTLGAGEESSFKIVQAIRQIIERILLLHPTSSTGTTDNTVVRFDGTDGAIQGTGITIDDSNNVAVPIDGHFAMGAAAAVGVFQQDGGPLTPNMEILGADSSDGDASIAALRFAASAGGPYLILGHSRTATIGSHTAVQAGDALGSINFDGSDGDSFRVGAGISAFATANWADNDVPGGMYLFTTIDGGVSFGEGLRVDQAQRVSVHGEFGGTREVGGSISPNLEVIGTDDAATFGVLRFSNDDGIPRIRLVKSKTATIGNHGLVGANVTAGEIAFMASDGDQYLTPVRLLASIDGTAANNDMPGALLVQTTPDGSDSIVTRFVVDNKGSVAVGPVRGTDGILATDATDGFLYVPACAGTPTGTPTTYTGRAPIVVNTTNNKLYFYSGGAWRDAGP